MMILSCLSSCFNRRNRCCLMARSWLTRLFYVDSRHIQPAWNGFRLLHPFTTCSLFWASVRCATKCWFNAPMTVDHNFICWFEAEVSLVYWCGWFRLPISVFFSSFHWQGFQVHTACKIAYGFLWWFLLHRRLLFVCHGLPQATWLDEAFGRRLL